MKNITPKLLEKFQRADFSIHPNKGSIHISPGPHKSTDIEQTLLDLGVEYMIRNESHQRTFIIKADGEQT